MREIKFRAWDKKNKKMISHEKLFSGVEIMNYTGIKDCNGKELYEGDIVVCKDEPERYVMTMEKTGYLAKQIGVFGHCIGPAYWKNSLLVIGNIYDNPELLEVAHDEKA